MARGSEIGESRTPVWNQPLASGRLQHYRSLLHAARVNRSRFAPADVGSAYLSRNWIIVPFSGISSRWINVLLFSAYHLFSPWQNATRIIGFAPLVYVVAWKRNIRIGMWAHCLTNTLGMIQALAALL